MTKQKLAIISGVSGQDGSYLSELLLQKGYKVVGLKRRTSLINTDRIDHLLDNPNFSLVYWDVHDTTRYFALIKEYQPDEIYNLAAQSHVKVSFIVPEETFLNASTSTLRWLEAIKTLKPDTKFYQASSSELYGDEPCPLTGFDENSKMSPASPYAIGKLAAHHLVRNYRISYGLFACSGILFNHTSPRRGENFVCRKIVDGVKAIRDGKQKELFLGNLDAVRDFSHSQDCVEMMFLMMQQDKPDDFVIGSGETISIRDFCATAFDLASLNWEDYVRIDPKFFRPHEVPFLKANTLKAQKQLGWKPKFSIEEIIKDLYEGNSK